jgi:uncharacterized protein (TIGR03083 family)
VERIQEAHPPTEVAMDRGQIYAETRGRVVDLVRTLSPEELDRKTLTCPQWSPKDVVAHLTGLVADILTGNTESGGSEAWTAAQVNPRRDQSLEEILAEWAERTPAFEAFLDEAPPDISARLIGDCYAHEQDIRGVTGRPGAQEAPALSVSLELQISLLGQRLDEAGLPALRLKAGGGEWTAGQAEVGATVVAPSTFELLRALHGRRSRAQVGALGWDGDGPARYLDVFPRFAPPTQDIVE